MTSDDDSLGGKVLAFRPREAAARPLPHPAIEVLPESDIPAGPWSRLEADRGYVLAPSAAGDGVLLLVAGGPALLIRRGDATLASSALHMLDALADFDKAWDRARLALRHQLLGRFRAGAVWTLEEERLGDGSTWKLLRAERPEATWWEVWRDGKVDYRGLLSTGHTERREVAVAHLREATRGKFSCGELIEQLVVRGERGAVLRVRSPYEHDQALRSKLVECRRRAHHDGAHKNRMGVEWSEWPRVVASSAVVPFQAAASNDERRAT